jgi:pimeloyl-ACP methyl ester carboxylesterase
MRPEPRHEGTVDLPDGLRLGYAEYGAADGIPVLYFHGLPAGRFYSLGSDALESTGTRLLTLERPGFGLSDPQPERTLLDWPKNVAAFADAMRLDRFAVLGASMGGPSSVACGFALPDRVAAVGLECAMGPVFDNPQFDSMLQDQMQALLPIARADADGARDLVRAVVTQTSDTYRADPAEFFETFVAGWSKLDQPKFRAARPMWERCLDATWARGPDACTDEYIASLGPWDFEPADVTVLVHAWHGDADDMAPIDAIRWLVAQVPNGNLVEHPAEGHVLDESHHAEWLASLTAWAR